MSRNAIVGGMAANGKDGGAQLGRLQQRGVIGRCREDAKSRGDAVTCVRETGDMS